MDEDRFNMSVRKFLRKLGVTAQREIELAVREQLEGGELQGDGTLEATATVTVAGLSHDAVVPARSPSPSARPRTSRPGHCVAPGHDPLGTRRSSGNGPAPRQWRSAR